MPKKSKAKSFPKIPLKVETELDVADLLYKMVEVCPAKSLLKLLYITYMHEGAPYIMSMLATLAEKKDVENAEAALALTYLMNNWDEAVEKGSEILKEKIEKEDNKD